MYSKKTENFYGEDVDFMVDSFGNTICEWDAPYGKYLRGEMTSEEAESEFLRVTEKVIPNYQDNPAIVAEQEAYAEGLLELV